MPRVRIGRVYEAHFTADDGEGGMCTGSIEVGVPHNKKAVPTDNGQRYEAAQR